MRLLNDEEELTRAGLEGESTQAADQVAIQKLMRRLQALPVELTEQPAASGVVLPEGEFQPRAHTDEHLAILAPAQGAGELGWLGAYRILQVLGRGGMGVVFLAEDPQLRRRVAVKALLPSRAGDEGRGRFLREARSVAALEHEHIVPIYQVAEERGTPFFVMKLLQGESLEARLSRESPLPLPVAIRVAKEIALGLAAAHEQGLIHRDIKPANIWLESPSGRVKIVDFGLARPAIVETALTRTGTMIGTPAYMAPEQARGEPIQPQCDLFSLGCVLYQLVTGKSPFERKSLMHTILAVATHSPPPPEKLRPDCPEALSQLILQLLAKDPQERLGSAHEVAERLDAC